MNNTDELRNGANVGANAVTTRTRTKPQKHGLTKLLKADLRHIDGRSALGIAISTYRNDLTTSLGGKDNLSVQEITLVELCSRDWAMLGQIDNYLLTVGLFSKRKKSAWPLLSTRLQVADGLSRRLLALRLEKRSRPARSLNELLNASPEPAQAVDAAT